MPTINEILQSEHANNGIVRLYPEGIFYKAYEYSAYLFVNRVRNYKLKRKYYKVVAREVVSMGFPMSALPTLPLPQGVEAEKQEDGSMVISLNTPVNEAEFAEWKATIPMDASETKTSASAVQQNPPPQPAVASERIVLDRLKRFRLEGATPMECLLLIAELRKILING